MNILKTVILTTSLAYACSVHVNTLSSYKGVVLGVKDRNRCNCIHFITAGLFGHKKLTTLERQLGENNVFAQASQSSQLLKTLEGQKTHCSHPLVVFLEPPLKSELIQLSLSTRFSGPTWLVFLANDESLESIFLDVKVAFDSKVLVAEFKEEGRAVSITEVYRIAPHLALLKNRYGWWAPETGFNGPKLELYSRRNNLQGVVLRVSSFDDPPVNWLSHDLPNVIDGYFGEVWKVVAQKVNFTFIIIPPEHGAHGVRMANGSWDGAMGQIQRNEVDIVITGTTLSLYRMEVPRFSIPIYTVQFKIFIREPEGYEVSWGSILSPFSPPLWATVFLTAATAALFLSLLYKFDRRFNPRTDRRKVSLYDTAFFVFGAMFCQQSHDQSPRSLACCIVYLVVYLCGMIIIGSYSAMLISFLTVFIPRMPFTDLVGLLGDKSYSLGTQRNASMIRFFQETQDQLLKEVYSKKISLTMNNAPVTQPEGFQRVCDQKYAHMGAAEVGEIMRKLVSCQLFTFPKSVNKVYGGFATYPKNSPYADLFDHTLLDMFQSGIIRRVARQFNYRVVPHRVTTVKSVSFEAITPFLSIIFGGVLLGSALVLLERYAVRFHRNKTDVVSKRKRNVVRLSKRKL